MAAFNNEEPLLSKAACEAKMSEVKFSGVPESWDNWDNWENLKTALLTLRPKKGDIWVVDANQIDIDRLSRFQSPEITWHLPIIVAFTQAPSSLEQAIRTVDLITLKRIVAEMEAESST